MKELNEDGFEIIDGKPVRLYEIRFTGSILLTPDEAASIGSGDQVAAFVSGRVQPPKFSQVTKTGEYKRQNVIKLESLIPIDPDQAAFVCDTLNVKVNGVNDGIVETIYIAPEEEQDLGFNPEEGLLI
jgi:hypothetical protein